jgi:hypothetical protein
MRGGASLRVVAAAVACLLQLSAACEDSQALVVPTETALDFAASPPPRVGLEAFASLVELPVLKRGVRAYGASSAASSTKTTVGVEYDPNDDYANYRSQSPSERVLLDVVGAGAIYRFWHTDDAMDAWAGEHANPGGSPITYNVYFDGATTPALQLSGPDFWRGRIASFPAPLTLDADATSGGAVTYRPIPFRQGVKVTALVGTDYPKLDYYNIGYSLYADADGRDVATYGAQEDLNLAREILANVGRNPIPRELVDLVETQTFDLASGSTVSLGPWSGPSLITELILTVPNLRREEYPVTSDDGRSTRSRSSFELAIAPDNTAVKLVRRLADDRAQAADVYVDGQLAGRWSTPGRGDGYSPTRAVTAWLDSAFELPPALTVDKSRIKVRIEVIPPQSDYAATWNEYRYWAKSTVAGVESLSDELDVGNAGSEAVHAYAMIDSDGSYTDSYRPLEPVVIEGSNDARALASVRLQIFWDGATEPAVDAPVSELFGTGAGFVARVQSLMLGHEAGRFYCYFPMPFARSARIVLVSPEGTPALHDLSVSTQRRPYMIDFADVGYFHAERRAVDATTPGKDYEILVANGQGHYVGVNLILPAMNWTMEGDEHIFVDGLRTPSISGTGTEDYANGGWYFSRGPFTAAFSGSPERGRTAHPVSAYRLHVTDYVPFRNSIRVALEHDGINGNRAPYASVAYYYLNTDAGMRETDAFEPAESGSAAMHRFSAEGAPKTSAVSGRFFNDALADDQTHEGVASSERSQFTVSVDPQNSGVVLRRLFDQAMRDQRADVYVADQFAGTWYTAGGDEAFRWREDEFWIPAELTRDRAQLDVRLEVRGAGWNAFDYRVFTLTQD